MFEIVTNVEIQVNSNSYIVICNLCSELMIGGKMASNQTQTP